MAGNNIFNDKDTMDINELAALNDDISPDLIEQLQQKLMQEALSFNQQQDEPPAFDEYDDTTLFEEPKQPEVIEVQPIVTEIIEPEPIQEPVAEVQEVLPIQDSTPAETGLNVANDAFAQKFRQKLNQPEVPAEIPTETNESVSEDNNIAQVSNGNITERKLTQEQKKYNDSLDFLDNNVKYSKYVIYIDPNNVDFIEGLSVKERKNLINKILREQDDIAITKQRFRIIQTIVRHVIVAIITVAISIPVIYHVINASLEASINNYRRSQSNFQVLYREKGKIQAINFKN